MLSYKDLIFYLLLAMIPAIFINQFLLKTIQPKISVKRLLIYIIVLLVVTFVYTFLAGWMLLRFVWPHRQ
jgi:hypothetical protein